MSIPDVEQRRCPDQDCKDCTNPFKVQPFSSTMMMKQLEGNKIKHECKKNDKSKTNVVVEMTILELFKHLENGCPIKYSFCPLCQLDCGSQQAVKNHLKYDCGHVVLECDMCDQQFKRFEFVTHHCSQLAAPFRHVIKR